MMNRKQFIRIGSYSVLASLLPATVYTEGNNSSIDMGLMKQMTDANDKLVSVLLSGDAPAKAKFARRTGQDLATLAASWVTSGSKYYESPEVLQRMELLTALLLEVQAPDGTVNIGNLESPPDTSFLLESVTAAAYILKQANKPASSNVSNELKTFIQRAGESLITGGVHTPNHRWVICAALARLNRLYPDRRYIDRIEQWLAERIFMDKDGHYPERSQIYSYVENNSLITMSRLLNKPALLNYVDKNLRLEYYHLEPNGDLVSFDSRRQDQYTQTTVMPYYFEYRYMANKKQDGFFAAVTKYIETLPGFDKVLDDGLYHVLDNELLKQQLPSSASLPTNYEKLMTTSSLLRIRRNQTTITLFGGTDQPIEIASGRSNSPNIFAYRKGAAILRYLRLSTSFFSTGYFYSKGIKQVGKGYELHSSFEAPYYQPLPKNKQKADGDYALTPSVDGRFWNKMDFASRPVSNVKKLDTTVTLHENNGACELHFKVDGQAGVQVTIELCFDAKGELSGDFLKEGDNRFLQSGTAAYKVGNDQISFGPGMALHTNIRNLEGERYTTHFGSLRTEGLHVYITGITPFDTRLQFA